jgi:hypothetical protein
MTYRDAKLSRFLSQRTLCPLCEFRYCCDRGLGLGMSAQFSYLRFGVFATDSFLASLSHKSPDDVERRF